MFLLDTILSSARNSRRAQDNYTHPIDLACIKLRAKQLTRAYTYIGLPQLEKTPLRFPPVCLGCSQIAGREGPKCRFPSLFSSVFALYGKGEGQGPPLAQEGEQEAKGERPARSAVEALLFVRYEVYVCELLLLSLLRGKHDQDYKMDSLHHQDRERESVCVRGREKSPSSRDLTYTCANPLRDVEQVDGACLPLCHETRS